jgi:CMP-N,N'-diacetyllegionaminic acid synthase
MKFASMIPARGGSKGIPRKNLINVVGRPLISYAINASLSSNINETWVSTDDEEIAKVAISFGSNVLKRPAELAQDNSPTEDAIQHFIDNVQTDYVVLIQPTSPLVTCDDINNGINVMLQGKYDSIFSAVQSNDILVWNENMTPVNYNPFNRGNRQNRKQIIYIETGGFYIFSKKGFDINKNRLHGKIGISDIHLHRSFEIDEIEDIKFIEKVMGI